VLARLKNDISTRHIAVCVISTDESRTRAFSSGALAFLGKPLQSKDMLDAFLDRLRGYLTLDRKRLLLVEPDAKRRKELEDFLAADDIEICSAIDRQSALDTLREREFDCVAIDTQTSGLDPSILRENAINTSATGAMPIVLFSSGEDVPRNETGIAWRIVLWSSASSRAKGCWIKSASSSIGAST